MKQFAVKRAKFLLQMAWGRRLDQMPDSLINDVDLVSFDVYDTLVCRSCAEPADVFRIVGNQIGDPSFFDKRKRAEALARSKTPSGETTLHHIYAEYPGLKEDRAANLMSIEMNAELGVSVRNAEMGALFDSLRKKGKRIAIVSDMYLPSDFVEKVLDHCGYSGYERLFVSGDLGLSKRKGDLFDYVCKRLSLQPDRVLHIGDHPLSDYRVPRKHGLRAFLYARGR